MFEDLSTKRFSTSGSKTSYNMSADGKQLIHNVFSPTSQSVNEVKVSKISFIIAMLSVLRHITALSIFGVSVLKLS